MENGTKEERKALLGCYQAEYQDSMGSLANVIAMVAVEATLLSLMTGIMPDGCLGIWGDVIMLGLAIAMFVYAYIRIRKISRENAKFRNGIMALEIMGTEKKGGKKKDERMC